MKNTLLIGSIILTCSLALFSATEVQAQGKGHGNGNSKQHKEYKAVNTAAGKPVTKAGNGKAYKNKGKGNGRSFPHVTPHALNVPPGHYPPAGMYRIWYPGRPPGQQPQPVAYGYPPNAPISDGAFILHSGRAYDTQYDWRQEEAKKPRSVPRQVIDILFPSNTLPAQ